MGTIVAGLWAFLLPGRHPVRHPVRRSFMRRWKPLAKVEAFSEGGFDFYPLLLWRASTSSFFSLQSFYPPLLWRAAVSLLARRSLNLFWTKTAHPNSLDLLPQLSYIYQNFGKLICSTKCMEHLTGVQNFQRKTLPHLWLAKIAVIMYSYIKFFIHDNGR